MMKYNWEIKTGAKKQSSIKERKKWENNVENKGTHSRNFDS